MSIMRDTRRVLNVVLILCAISLAGSQPAGRFTKAGAEIVILGLITAGSCLLPTLSPGRSSALLGIYGAIVALGMHFLAETVMNGGMALNGVGLMIGVIVFSITGMICCLTYRAAGITVISVSRLCGFVAGSLAILLADYVVLHYI